MKSNSRLQNLKKLLKELDEKDTGSTTAEEGRRRLVVAEAGLKQLALQERRGTLLDKSEVEAAAFNRAREERDALLNWPARVAPLVAAEFSIDPRQLFASLEKHVRQFLDERSQAGPLFSSRGKRGKKCRTS